VTASPLDGRLLQATAWHARPSRTVGQWEAVAAAVAEVAATTRSLA